MGNPYSFCDIFRGKMDVVLVSLLLIWNINLDFQFEISDALNYVNKENIL